MAITEHTSGSEERRRYVRPPRPIHFPSSEEVPETNRHLELRTALYQILKRELAARATLGSDQQARDRLAAEVAELRKKLAEQASPTPARRPARPRSDKAARAPKKQRG